MKVYDKAKYHFESCEEHGLGLAQAYVHTGMFVGWLIRNDLLSAEWKADAEDDIRAFLAKQVTGPGVYSRWDGALLDEMLSKEGNAFSASYFDFSNGQFLVDYDSILAGDLPSQFHVEDTWLNFELLAPVIDERYRAFRGV